MSFCCLLYLLWVEDKLKAEALIFEARDNYTNRTYFETFKMLAGPDGHVTWDTFKSSLNATPNIYIVETTIVWPVENGQEQIKIEYHVNIRTEEVNASYIEINGEPVSSRQAGTSGSKKWVWVTLSRVFRKSARTVLGSLEK